MKGIMKLTWPIAGKIVVSGISGILVFAASIVIASYLLVSYNLARNPDPGVLDGGPAILCIQLGIVLSIFLSGVLSALLTFKDVATSGDVVRISLFSGLIPAIIPLFIGALMGLDSTGIFGLCLVVVFIGLALSVLGGVATYWFLAYLRKNFWHQWHDNS